MSHYILAIDQGTTNTKALLVDREGVIVGRGSVPTPVYHPKAGWVEQDPQEIWQCTREAIARCLAAAGERAAIAAIGISNQRETALLWDRQTGAPAGPAVVWQCRRSAAICQRVRAAGHAPALKARTGLQLDPMFSGSKLRWLLDHAEDGAARAARGELCFGNVDAWLLWHLTGGPPAAVHATDTTNASRTQLMNLKTLRWDAESLGVFGIPAGILPTIRPSSGHFGVTQPLSLPNGPMLPGGIPVASMIGDSHASLYGLGGFHSGSVKATYGTGTSLMTTTSDAIDSAHGISTTIAWSLDEQDGHRTNRAGTSPKNDPASQLALAQSVYALEGNIYTTGGAVQYIGELLGLSQPADEIEALANTVADTAGVTFVPALVGLGAPYWQDSAKGTITGLTLGTGRAHLARAAIEAIAFQVRDIFDVVQAEAGMPLHTLLADGGASRNDLLMQLQADFLGCPVERSRSAEVSPLGAAYLAGLAVGFWRDEAEIATLMPMRDRFEPRMSTERRREAYARWQLAVQRTLLTSDPCEPTSIASGDPV